MRKILLLLTSLVLININVFGQYTFDWMQPSGNYAKKSVMSVVDSTDHLIVTGYMQSYRMFTRKYDILGSLLWEVQDSSGIQSIYEKPNWISCDTNDNILVVGNQYSIGPSYDYPSAIVAIKYSPSGTLLWKTVIPISILINSQTSFDCRGVVDASGNLYIGTAITNGAYLYKIDTNGNLLFSNSSAINAPKNFNGMRIRNNIIAMATSSGTTNVAPVFVWNTSGTLLWTANANGILAADVEIDENENVYVLSSLYYMINPITYDYDAQLTKYSSAGGLLWTHHYDFGGYNFVTRMTYVNSRISAIGYGNSSGIKWETFQIDTNGILLWSAPYTVSVNPTFSDEYPHYVLAKPTGEVIVTGVGGPTPDPFNPSYNQMPIVQYSNTGVQNWVSTPNIYGGTGLACMFASDASLYAISSNDMTVYHYNTVPLSISNQTKNDHELVIYPNPVSSLVTIEFYLSENQNVSISIVDAIGQLVKYILVINSQVGKNNLEINLSELNSGIYFCKVASKENIQSIKLFKY